jgi:hypothetical protein
MPFIDLAERRARLGRRHHLARSSLAHSPVQVAQDLVALHATDPATVFLSLAARLEQPEVQTVERALYETRALLRMLGMRRTMFVVPTDFAPVVQAACTSAVAQRLRRTYQQLLEDAGMADDVPSWLARVESDTLSALQKRGEATAQDLSRDVPELKRQVLLAEGKPYEAVQGISTRVLMQLSADGKIVRGRPRGSWISGQYRWSTIEAWLPGGLEPRPVAEARVALVREWLRSFGPGTFEDLKWWTGLTMGEVKRAVSHVDVVRVSLGESEGLALADDMHAVAPPEPWVALLPGLDPTPMGYAERSWFLGGHARALFDRSGNIGPTVWSDGRIVGGWAQRRDGTIAWKLLEDVGHEVESRVADNAQRLGEWLGAVRVTPRFRTPLERELSA